MTSGRSSCDRGRYAVRSTQYGVPDGRSWRLAAMNQALRTVYSVLRTRYAPSSPNCELTEEPAGLILERRAVAAHISGGLLCLKCNATRAGCTWKRLKPAAS